MKTKSLFFLLVLNNAVFAQLTIQSSGPLDICGYGNNPDTLYVVSPQPGFTYTWYIGGYGCPNGSSAPYSFGTSMHALITGEFYCIGTSFSTSLISNSIRIRNLPGMPNSPLMPAPRLYTGGPPCSPSALLCIPDIYHLNWPGTIIQWYKDNVIIIGASSGSYIATATGYYKYSITSSCMTAWSDSSFVTATPPAAVITTAGPTIICPSGSVVLNANTGTGLSYQWRLNGINISGATAISYSASAAGNYDCIVTNACGSSTSNIIIVTVAGTCSMGMLFNGSSSRATINDNAAYAVGAGDFTLEAWIKASASQPVYPIIASKRGSTYSGFLLFLYQGKLSVQIGGFNYVSTSNNLRDNACHHVAVTRTGTTIKFYIDGALISTLAAGNYNINSTHGLWFGNDEPNPNAFNGLIHEFRFWNLVRSQAQIMAARDTFLSGSETGLIGYWRMNEGAGQTVHDYSLTGNNGVLGASASPETIDPSFSSACIYHPCTPPTAAITAGGPTTVCLPATVTLNANIDTGITYQWRLNGGNIAGATASSYTASSAGNYDCVVSNSCISVASNVIAVIVNSAPSASISASGPVTFCAPGSVTLGANTGPGFSYQWRLNSAPITGATSSSYVATSTGNYDCIVSNSCGSTPSNTIMVTANSAVTASITAGGPTTFCYGGNVILYASPTGSGYTYQWRNNGVDIAGATAASYMATVQGNYDVVISNPCVAVSGIITVTVTGGPTVITLQPNAALGIDALISSYPDYVNSNFGTHADLAAKAGTSSSIAFVTRGLIKFDLSSISVNTLVYQASLQLFNNPTSIFGPHGGANASWLQKITSPWDENTVTWNNQPTTTTANQVTLPQSTSGNQDYTLDVTTLVQDMVNNPTSNYGFMLRLQIESYYRALIFASSDCADATKWPKLVITLAPAPPLASITAAGPTTFCSSGSVTLNANTGSGLSYQWRLNSSPITGATTSSYVATTGGSYDCIVSNSCSSATSNIITVTVNSAPAAFITASGPTTFCVPGYVILNANTGVGLSYQWRLNGGDIAGATSSSYSATTTGNYDCIVSNTCGSVVSNVISVTVNPLPPAAIIASGPTTFCSPGYVVLNANTGTGLSYQWRLNGGDISGATASTYGASAGGNYDCIVTNSCGSTTSNALSVTVVVIPATPGSIAGQTTGVCASTLSYSISPVTGATSYNWTVPAGASFNSGQGTTSVNVVFTNSFGGGSVSVVATNFCGSGGASSLAITGAPAQPGNITGPASVCHNQNNVDYTITAVTGATSYTWTVPAGTQIKNGQGTTHIRVRFGNSAGNITVRAGNACGLGPIRILAIAMPCREAEELDDNFNVILYPNPATDVLNVRCNTLYGNEKIKIFNAVGEIIQKSEIRNQESAFDIGSLPGGMYFAEIISGGQKKVLKFIKHE